MKNSSSHNHITETDRGQGPEFSTECPAFLSGHFQQLHNFSGISIEVINERGYESILGSPGCFFSLAQPQGREY